MDNFSVAIGIALVLLGTVAYVVTGGQSVTALIPAFFGIPFALLGLLARDEGRRKTTMHLAAVLALLGFLGSARGVPDVIALAGGAEVARPAAAVVQSAMAALCITFLVFAVRSFVLARRARPL
jgi:hypothetical protein